MMMQQPHMHWVMATSPDGRRTALNLARCVNMLVVQHADGRDVTLVFFGGIAPTQQAATNAQGQPVMQHGVEYAKTAVLETPEQLLAALPVVVPMAFVKGETSPVRPADTSAPETKVAKLNRKGSSLTPSLRKDTD